MKRRKARRARSAPPPPAPAPAPPALRPAFALGALLLLAAALLLYWSALRHPLVFDDIHLSESALKAHFAQVRAWFGLRWISDASFGWVYALFGKDMIWQRLANLLLHAATGAVLFGFLARLFGALLGDPRSRWLAFFGAALFILHPVAVYGVAYLMQRSILLATLFALLALWGVLEWLLRGSPRWSGWYVAAAGAYYLAVYAKEHAVMLPAVAVALALLVRGASLELARRGAIPLLLFAAIGVTVILSSKGVLGSAYEPFASDVVTNLGEAGGMLEAGPVLVYPLSVLNQATLYFRYLFTWLLPWPGWMSIDVRTAFPQTLFEWPYLAGFAAWLAYPVVALWLLLKRGAAGLLGFGLLYPWLLALTEVATVRVQEPFVLYRSYLWMSGLPAIVPLLAGRLAPRWRIAVLAAACLLLVLPARDRLESFSSALSLWDDAIGKNTDVNAPYVERGYINRAIVHFKAGRRESARADLERAVALNPRSADAHLARATLRMSSGALNEALDDVDRAIALRPRYASAYNLRCGMVMRLGRPEKAIADCEKAVALDPGNHEAWNNAGFVYRALERDGDAAASYERALKLKPTDPSANYNYGVLLFDSGRRDEAVRRRIVIGCEGGIQAACDLLKGRRTVP
jgi:tetratricopeptide (TPR) repeat protein